MYPYIIENHQNLFLDSYIKNKKEDLFQIANTIGAVLFRNFALRNIDDFYNIISLFHEVSSSYVGGDSPRTMIKNNIYTSTEYPSDQEISMHQEMSFSNIYPKFLYLFCDIEPKTGGETPILDSRILYQQLNTEIINKFKEKKLKYVMNMNSGKGIGKSWQQTYEVDNVSDLELILTKKNIKYKWKDNGLLEVYEIVNPIIQHSNTQDWIFFSQAHQWHSSGLDKNTLELLRELMPEEDFFHNCYYGDGSKIELSYLDEIRNLINKNKVIFKWQKGDLLMLDNIVSMHGRNPFIGERRILVAMS